MWYFQYNNQQNGPIDAEVIKALLNKQTLTRETLVWKEGLNHWCRLADTELKSLLPVALPPPSHLIAVHTQNIQPPPLDQRSALQEAIVSEGTEPQTSPTDSILPDYFKTKSGIKSLWIWSMVSLGLGLSLTIYGASVSANQADYGYDGDYGPALILGVLMVACGAILWWILFYRSWAVIQDGCPPTTPGKAVGFMLIPLFNYYWQFVAILGLAKEMNRYCANRGIPATPVDEQLTLAYCVLFCTLWIPYLNIVTGIVFAIMFFLVWQSIMEAVCTIVTAKSKTVPVLSGQTIG